MRKFFKRTVAFFGIVLYSVSLVIAGISLERDRTESTAVAQNNHSETEYVVKLYNGDIWVFSENDAIKRLDIDYDGPFNMETKLFNPGNAWPNYRHKITDQSGAQPILFDPDEELRYLSLDIMYKLAEYALKKYNIQVE